MTPAEQGRQAGALVFVALRIAHIAGDLSGHGWGQESGELLGYARELLALAGVPPEGRPGLGLDLAALYMPSAALAEQLDQILELARGPIQPEPMLSVKQCSTLASWARALGGAVRGLDIKPSSVVSINVDTNSTRVQIDESELMRLATTHGLSVGERWSEWGRHRSLLLANIHWVSFEKEV